MALRHAAAAAAAARLGSLQPTAAARLGGLRPTAVRDVFFLHSKARLSTLEKDARLSTLEKDARTLEKDYIVQIEKMKELLYTMMAEADRHRLIGGFRGFEYANLLHHLSAHIEPRPHDPHWRLVARIRSIRFYMNLAGSWCLGLTVANALDWYVKAAKEEEYRKQLLLPFVHEDGTEYEDLLRRYT